MILVKAPESLGSFKGAYKKIRAVLCLSIAVASLGGCGFDFFSGDNTSKSSSNSSTATVQTSGISYDGAIVPGQRSPITVPPPLNAATASAPGNLSSLQPPRGINAQRLFSAPLKDEGQRFERVEGEVQNLRDEVDGFTPAITRLVAVEKDIQDLVEQLDVLLQNEPGAGAIAPAPVPTPIVSVTPELPPVPAVANVQKTSKATASAPKIKISAGASGLNNIRISDNLSTTRIVFESSKKLGHRAELDNLENILLIDFTNGKNSVNLSNIRVRSKLLKTVSQTAGSNGDFTLAFELKNASAVVKQGDISPNKDNANYRYFIDLKR